jgi:SAM-dependent methyltransferase
MFIKTVLEFLSQIECSLSRKWVSSAHKRLRWVQWSLPPQPEHFDHHIDLYYQWLAKGINYWLERGVFGSLCLKGGRTLDLSCGDGFNSRNFYSTGSSEVIACDFDPKAIKTAKRKNSSPKIKFILKDIRIDLPEGKFDNVFWDAAIEHFTETEIDNLMPKIKSALNPGGIISGFTIVEKADNNKSLSHHEYEFSSKEDLLRFFTPCFKNVKVFEITYPQAHCLYFWASDGIIPFSPEWKKCVSVSKK